MWVAIDRGWVWACGGLAGREVCVEEKGEYYGVEKVCDGTRRLSL